MDDHVSAREVQPRAARFERDEEERLRARVEVAHAAHALKGGRRAVEVGIAEIHGVEARGDVAEHRRELREDEDAVSGSDGIGDDFFEHVELA